MPRLTKFTFLLICKGHPRSSFVQSMTSFTKTLRKHARIQSVCYTDDLIKRGRSSMAKLQRQLSQEHFSAEGFGLVMDAYTSTCIDALINAFDLSQHKIVVDLGGGFGMLAESLADKYPKMKVTVFEQDHVIQMAKNLKPDFKINMIQGGQLFVVEKFLSEDKTGPENPVISSLFSAIMDLEGDYRTEQEYRGLLENAGFCSIQSKRIEGYNDHDVMLATKD